MSLNQTHSYNRKITDRLGKYFSTIDFTFNENITADSYIHKSKHSIVGSVDIGHNTYDINLHELEQLKSTIDRALEVLERKYRTGLM